MPDLFDGISTWLLDRAMQDADLSETLVQLAGRLVDGGVPVNRINVGRSLLHPIIGVVNLKWDKASDQVTTFTIPRSQMSMDILMDSPFGDMSVGKTDQVFANLTDPEQVARYGIFGELAAEGITGYAAFGRRFGIANTLIEGLEDFRGASISFTTRRFSGFSAADEDGLGRLITPLCLCLRIATERFLATELLETYLGRISGQHVYTGQSARGDGQTIECALLYSDMRNSLGLSQILGQAEFLACVNQYFDCTAGAVLEHGGEVLKFIGDGVLAIFPFEEDVRPRANMCAAALSAARESFARASHANGQRQHDGAVPLEFGVALHAGKVIYGNVGTEKRLDFTATGLAVGLVSRCEALTRTLQADIIATRDFVDQCPDGATAIGEHAIRGFDDPVALHTFDTSEG